MSNVAKAILAKLEASDMTPHISVMSGKIEAYFQAMCDYEAASAAYKACKLGDSNFSDLLAADSLSWRKVLETRRGIWDQWKVQNSRWYEQKYDVFGGSGWYGQMAKP